MKFLKLLVLSTLFAIVFPIQLQSEPKKGEVSLNESLPKKEQSAHATYPISLKHRIKDALITGVITGYITWVVAFLIDTNKKEQFGTKSALVALIPALLTAAVPVGYTMYQYCLLIKCMQCIKNDIEFIGVSCYENLLDVLKNHENKVRSLGCSLRFPKQVFDLITEIYKIKRKLVADYVSTAHRLSSEKKQNLIQKLNIFLTKLENVLFEEPRTSMRLAYEQPIQEILADELAWYLEARAVGVQTDENRIAHLFGRLYSKKFISLNKAMDEHNYDYVHIIFEKICLELGLPVKPLRLQFLENI